MHKLFFFPIAVLLAAYSQAQQRFQLAPPLLKYTSVFFKDTTSVQLQFAQPGTTIHYTTNGSEPGTQSNVFQKPIPIHKRLTTVKAKTFGPAFTPSETVQATFIKEGVQIESVTATAPDTNHTGNGPHTLFDGEGGITDLHNKNWLGYRQDSVLLDVNLAETQRVHAVLLNLLQDQDSWIFLPQQVVVYYYDRHGVLKKLAQKELSATAPINGSRCVYQVLTATKNVRTNRLKILLKPVTAIPDGHPGKGQPGWLFIDEIKVY